MPMIVAGLLLLWLSSILLRGFARGNPAAMARLMHRGGGSAALILAALLIFRGEFNLAVLAGGAGFWLLARSTDAAARPIRPGAWSFADRRQARSPGPIRFRTDSLDVVVDRATGAVQGGFVSGPYAGRGLDTLSEAECAAGYRWCCGTDAQGTRLLEGYFDGRFAGWREAAQFGFDPGRAQAGGRTGRPVSMPDHEAYDVLGLAQGASREEITRAHRRLMKQYHPDHGGSTAMAARVNEAKDVLMRRHP